MPTSIESRCQVSIPYGATGEDSELCGGHASKVCENCGVICSSCAETFPCPLVSDGKHVFVTPNPTPAPITPIIIKGCSGGPEGKWDEVQAIQHKPFIYTMANGSKWAGEEEDDIEELLRTLATYRLNVEMFENKFFTVNPCRAEDNPKWSYDNPGEERWIDGERMYACDGVVRFFGNFANVSHVFDIDTNHKPTIDALMAAIEKNVSVIDPPEVLIMSDISTVPSDAVKLPKASRRRVGGAA